MKYFCISFPGSIVNIDNRTKINMSGLLYIIAIILLIGWLLGFFIFSLSGFIHLLLVFAIIAVLFRLIKGRSV